MPLIVKPEALSNEQAGKKDFLVDTKLGASYKATKVSTDSDLASNNRPQALEGDLETDAEAGPELPPDDEAIGHDDEEARFFGGGVTSNTADVLDYLDQKAQQDEGPQKIDVAWLRKMALNFEKKINKNTELRSKYEDSPQKFMGSEADLDADIKTLSILSQHPNLYEEFVRLGCVSSLVSLLSHENTDIAIDAIEIINELTDEDVDAEQAQWDALVDAMLQSDLLNLLYENINRMDEGTESDRAGTYHILSIIENLSSRSSASLDIGRHTKFIDWLLLRVSKRAARITQNEQYSAEVLTILLQSVPENRKVFVSKDGIDTCLQLLSAYRKKDPAKGTEEEEFVENIFDCLTCCVDDTDGKTKFLDAEGVELCLIMLREGKMSRSRALRLLDHALSGNDGGLGCERLVEAAGLKIIFNLYMKSQDKGMTEHLLGILSSLLRSVTANSELRIRLMAKFEERNWKVVDRLLQDRRRLVSAIHNVDEQIKSQKRQLSAEAQEEQADEWFSRRLDAGSFTLQTLDIIIAWLVAEDETGKNVIKKQLVDGGESLQDVKRTLQEQIDSIQTEDDVDDTVAMDMLQTLITFL